MRRNCFLLVLVTLVVIALNGFDRSNAQQPKSETAHAKPARDKIVPVVVLKPGERKDLFLSTACTVGITRGGGLDVREIGAEERSSLQSAKIWERDGVIVKVPDFGEGTKEAAAPQYQALSKIGIFVFRVNVAAGKDAKAGLYNLHLADLTCNGTCETDFRVLVVAP